MSAVCFLPDDPAMRAALDAHLAKRPKTRRIEWSALGDEPLEALTEAIAGADRKHGFVIVDGPRRVEDLQLIDQVCRDKLGRRGLPRGVFFAPRKAHDEWRTAVAPLHNHYHPDRRALTFKKPAPKQLVRSVKTAGRARSIIRWGALMPMAVIFLLAVGGVGFARDGLLHSAAISSLESAFVARSEIADLATTLTPSLELTNVAVADRKQPMRNVFEFDRFAGGLAVGPLMSGRVHIPELSLKGLRFGTARAESGALPDAPAPEPEPEIDATDAGPSFAETLDDLLRALEPPELEELEAVREARALEQEGRDRLVKLERLVRESSLPERYEAAKAKVQALGTIEAPDSFTQVEAAARELAALRPDPELLDAIRKDLDAALPSFDAEQQAIAAAQRDVESAGRAAKKAERLLNDARAIRKFTINTALKITKLLKDLAEADRELGKALANLNKARNKVQNAQAAVTKRLDEATKRLESGRAGLTEAQGILDRAAGDLPQRAQALTGSLAQAKADLEAGKAAAEAELAQLGKDLQAAKAEAQALQSELESGLQAIAAAPGRLTAALGRDRDELTRRYNLDRFTSDELLGPVVGDTTLEWLRWTLATYQRLEPLLFSDEESVAQKVAAHAGTIYRFPGDPETPPAFWVGLAHFSGTLQLNGKPFVLSGTATNLSSDLEASGADAHIEFLAELDGQSFRATVDVTRAGEVSVSIAVEGIRISGRLQNRRISAGFEDGTLGARLECSVGPNGARIAGGVELDGLEIALAEGLLDGRLEFLRALLAEIRKLEAEFELTFGGGKVMGLTASASVGEGFGAKVRSALTDQVTAARDLAFAKIEERVAGPRAQAEAALAEVRTKGGPAVEALLATLDGDTAAIEQAGAAALGQYGEMAKVLEVGDDPSGELEALRGELATLTAKSAALEGAAAKAAGEANAAGDEALELYNTQRDALKKFEAQVAKEVKRLTGLR